MNRVWTEEELEILRRDRAEKVPIPVTAAKLGRPVPATYARARLIGTLVQPHQSWDEASVARLRELVSADPPMTDKCIAAELGRTVTQIRWKMQDLGLIGIRNLSKLAKVTAAKTTRLKAEHPSSQKPAPRRPVPETTVAPARPTAAAQAIAPARQASPAPLDPRTALQHALKTLEETLAERLKKSVAVLEAGMVQAAKDAISEKSRIDQRLADLGRRMAEAEARRDAAAKQAEAGGKAHAEAMPNAQEAARQVSVKRARQEKPQQAEVRNTAVKKAAMPAVQGVARMAVPRPAPQPVAPPAPKIVVTEAPAAARLVEQEAGPVQMSGRGGWKSVRRDPARIMAQAKAKAANRADAIDLAQAAQAAIERFIAERGVTKTETDQTQALVTRLQARGYIVVRDGDGWVVDQRHRLANQAALVAFAEARGITLSIAA